MATLINPNKKNLKKKKKKKKKKDFLNRFPGSAKKGECSQEVHGSFLPPVFFLK
jgi:hypothetical protein